jgi:hypothetical protein
MFLERSQCEPSKSVLANVVDELKESYGSVFLALFPPSYETPAGDQGFDALEDGWYLFHLKYLSLPLAQVRERKMRDSELVLQHI